MDEVEAAIELLKTTYPDLVQPTAKQVGSGLATIVEFLTLPLLKLKYLNVKAKLRFRKRIERLVAEIDAIPVQDRTEIPSTIAVPALEKLSVESDDEISELFIRLLTNASSEKTVSLAHPSFVNIIGSISSDEVRIILRASLDRVIPFVVIRMQFNEREGLDKTANLTAIEIKMKLTFPQNIPAYLENLRALGLLEKPSGALSDIDKYYKGVEGYYSPLALKVMADGHPDGKRYPVLFLRGYYQITAFGDLFITACLRDRRGKDLLSIVEP